MWIGRLKTCSDSSTAKRSATCVSVKGPQSIINGCPVSQQMWHPKDPSLLNGHECRAKVEICSLQWYWWCLHLINNFSNRTETTNKQKHNLFYVDLKMFLCNLQNERSMMYLRHSYFPNKIMFNDHQVNKKKSFKIFNDILLKFNFLFFFQMFIRLPLFPITMAVPQWVRALAPRADVWVFES